MDYSGQPKEKADEDAQGAAMAEFHSRYQPLVAVALATGVGVVVDRYAPLAFDEVVMAKPMPHWFLAWWWLSIGCLFVWRTAWRGGQFKVAAWLLLAAVSMVGAAWHDLRWRVFDNQEIARFADFDPQPAAIKAVACEAPERLLAPRPTPLRAIPVEDRSRLVVQLTAIRDGTNWIPASGDCQLTVNGHLLGVHRGDHLQVFGQLVRPTPPGNPGEFNFAAVSRSERQLAQLRSSTPDCVTVVEPSAGSGIIGLPERLRRNGEQLLQRYVGPERAGLAAAILLGVREGVPADEMAAYLVTGTIHVLAVSGMNLSILASGLYWMIRLGWLPRRTGWAVAITAVIAYTLVAGGEPPIVRAAVLAVVLSVAAWVGRHGVAFNSLAAAALVVLAINPAELFRTGTQLSFLAVGALVWVGSSKFWRTKENPDRLDQLIAATRPWYVRQSKWAGMWAFWLCVTSFAVWFSALPLVMYQFHLVSPISVPISPAIWIVVSLAMWSGFLTVVFGLVFPPIAMLCGMVCNASLWGLETVVRWAESLPAGYFWQPGPAWWWVAGFYVGLIAVMIWGRAIAPPRWQVAALCGWILVGLLPPLTRAAMRNGLDCSFVSVGHGACVVLETPTGETILYDAGSLASPEFATQTIASYLWHRGITRIDGIVLSHADIDHYNAVPGLLDRFHVGAIYVSPMMFDGFGGDDFVVGGESRGPDVLRKAIERAGVPVREIWAGNKMQIGSEVTLEVLHPSRLGVIGSDNANSLVLAIGYKQRRILLTGDLETPGLEDVLAELPYDCDVLLAPHHGSRSSDPPGFAAWSSPEWVVISGGREDEAGVVAQTYEAAGARVLDTHDVGAIEFTIQGRSVSVESWQRGRSTRTR